MEKYYCICCNYNAKVKSSYDKHLKTKKHMEASKSHHLVTPKSPFGDFCGVKEPIRCHYCHKTFKYKQGMYRHIKYSCKKNKDEDFKELARLLNEKEKQLDDTSIQMFRMQKQIDKLSNKLQIKNIGKNINNGIIHQSNNTYNIQLLNHVDTDYSHVTHKDYISCIMTCNKCVKTLIEKTHFNEVYPQNMNIYSSNLKGKYLMVYKDNLWQVRNKKQQIDDLYDKNEMVLENWFDEYKEQYPHIVQSFQRYLKNRDGGEYLLSKLKEEIFLMLYNKRHMVSLEG